MMLMSDRPLLLSKYVQHFTISNIPLEIMIRLQSWPLAHPLSPMALAHASHGNLYRYCKDFPLFL